MSCALNKIFSSRCPAGRIGDRGDREIVHVPNLYVPFLVPTSNLEGQYHHGFYSTYSSVLLKQLIYALGSAAMAPKNNFGN